MPQGPVGSTGDRVHGFDLVDVSRIHDPIHDQGRVLYLLRGIEDMYPFQLQPFYISAIDLG